MNDIASIIEGFSSSIYTLSSIYNFEKKSITIEIEYRGSFASFLISTNLLDLKLDKAKEDIYSFIKNFLEERMLENRSTLWKIEQQLACALQTLEKVNKGELENG